MTIVFISKVKKIYIWLFWFHSFLVFFEIDIEVNRCLWETRLWELRTEYFPMSITSYSKSIPPPWICNASDECGVGTDPPQMGFPEMELMSCGNPGELSHVPPGYQPSIFTPSSCLERGAGSSPAMNPHH